MLEEQEYTQLKTELDNCVRVRNTLNTFMITTFVAVLALAYNYATQNVPYIFLFAQMLMIPVLVRIMDYKKTEARLSIVIYQKFGTERSFSWEIDRFKNRTFYFEFLTLSVFVTGWFFIVNTIFYAIGSLIITAVVCFLTYKTYKLSTDNCNESWCQLLFGCNKSDLVDTNQIE